MFVKCPAPDGAPCACTSKNPCESLRGKCQAEFTRVHTEVSKAAGGFPVLRDKGCDGAWPEELMKHVDSLVHLVRHLASVLPFRLPKHGPLECHKYCAVDHGQGLKGTRAESEAWSILRAVLREDFDTCTGASGDSVAEFLKGVPQCPGLPWDDGAEVCMPRRGDGARRVAQAPKNGVARPPLNWDSEVLPQFLDHVYAVQTQALFEVAHVLCHVKRVGVGAGPEVGAVCADTVMDVVVVLFCLGTILRPCVVTGDLTYLEEPDNEVHPWSLHDDSWLQYQPAGIVLVRALFDGCLEVCTKALSAPPSEHMTRAACTLIPSLDGLGVMPKCATALISAARTMATLLCVERELVKLKKDGKEIAFCFTEELDGKSELEPRVYPEDARVPLVVGFPTPGTRRMVPLLAGDEAVFGLVTVMSLVVTTVVTLCTNNAAMASAVQLAQRRCPVNSCSIGTMMDTLAALVCSVTTGLQSLGHMGWLCCTHDSRGAHSAVHLKHDTRLRVRVAITDIALTVGTWAQVPCSAHPSTWASVTSRRDCFGVNYKSASCSTCRIPSSVVYGLMAELLLHECVQTNAVAACTLTYTIPTFLRSHALHRCLDGMRYPLVTPAYVTRRLQRWDFCRMQLNRQFGDLLKLECWSRSAAACLVVCIGQFLGVCATDVSAKDPEAVYLENYEGRVPYTYLSVDDARKVVALEEAFNYVSRTGDVESVARLHGAIHRSNPANMHRFVVGEDMERAWAHREAACKEWQLYLEVYTMDTQTCTLPREDHSHARAKLKREREIEEGEIVEDEEEEEEEEGRKKPFKKCARG